MTGFVLLAIFCFGAGWLASEVHMTWERRNNEKAVAGAFGPTGFVDQIASQLTKTKNDTIYGGKDDRIYYSSGILFWVRVAGARDIFYVGTQSL
jgi:hypothetical protein